MKTLLKLVLPLVLATGIAIPAVNAHPERPDYRNDHERYFFYRDDGRRDHNAYSRQTRRHPGAYERERRQRVAETARHNRKYTQAQERNRRKLQAARERAYKKGLRDARRVYQSGYNHGVRDGYSRYDGRYRVSRYNDAAWSVIVDLGLTY